jgi:hypothetical protein
MLSFLLSLFKESHTCRYLVSRECDCSGPLLYMLGLEYAKDEVSEYIYVCAGRITAAGDDRSVPNILVLLLVMLAIPRDKQVPKE